MFTTITILFFTLIMLIMMGIAYADIAIESSFRNFAFNFANDALLDSQSSMQHASNNTDTPLPDNPHWNKNKCNLCHSNAKDSTPRGIDAIRKDDDLCLECHKDDVAHTYIHPVGLKLSNERRPIIDKRWNGDLRLNNKGVMTCYTCHDLLDQCLPERTHQKVRNPLFLRGGPFPNRYTLCYRCHDPSKYERINSHDQITKNGYLKIDKCRLCHQVDSNVRLKSGITKDLVNFPLLNDMDEDRTQLCVRCHRKIDHPSSAFTIKSKKQYRHLVRMDSNKKRFLKNMFKETGIKLPIEPNTDRIYCGTCHQPHQPGVFVGENNAEVVIDNHRLRAVHICKYCHEIYDTLLDSGYQ